MTAALAELNNSRRAKRLHEVTFAHLTGEEFSQVVQRAQQIKLAEKGKDASPAAVSDVYDDSGAYYFEFDKLVSSHPFLARLAIGVCRLLDRKPKQASA